MSPTMTDRDARVAQLLDEALAELRSKGCLDEASYRSRYPDLAEELPELLGTLKALDTAVEDWRLVSTPAESAARPGQLPASEPLPERIGRYRILAGLGAGGMGTVYQAEDPDLQRTVAVKVPRFEGSPEDRIVRVQRFLREARAAACIRHPHVCPIFDVGEHEGKPYVVMAYVEGQSLADRLRGRQRFEDVVEAVVLARHVAEALGAVHAHGIIHRDLKPANILLDAQGQAILTDFGLARPEQDTEHLTSEGKLPGTPAYMAPEQASGEADRLGAWTDLYSLGVVLYQMLTGRLPFEGPPLTVLHKLANDSPPPPTVYRADLDPGLEALLLKALARRPEERYQCAGEFGGALEQWATSRTRKEQVLATAAPVRRRVRVLALAAVLFLALTLALGAFAVYHITTDKGTVRLTVEVEDADVEVFIKQKGEVVKLLDTKTKRDITLRSGTYDVELAGGKDGLKLSTNRFVLKRGDQEIVRVYQEADQRNSVLPTSQWIARAELPTPRAGLMAAEIEGILYAVGGAVGLNDLGTVEAYNSATNKWTGRTLIAMDRSTRIVSGSPGRYCGTVGVIDGKLYLVGGWTNTPASGYPTGLPTDNLLIYDPVADGWSKGKSIPIPNRGKGTPGSAGSCGGVIGRKL